ncbi:hypothetical protein E2562_013372 [Oryza meyeriana var. granulata]|uniref:Uncharacterized protein n=1 Tax=Oryza meyeriana var. granulata TaxID=110450 RepID=A0A6G1CG37_9ORYZ|nr:hypothetical protein E2562_013372 [Oryza meyeriana var. granulata]
MRNGTGLPLHPSLARLSASLAKTPEQRGERTGEQGAPTPPSRPFPLLSLPRRGRTAAEHSDARRRHKAADGSRQLKGPL